MEFNLQAVVKKLSRDKKDLGEIEKNLKEIEGLEKDTEKNAYRIEDRLNKIGHKLEHSEDVEALAGTFRELKEFISDKRAVIEEPKHRLRLYIGSELEQRLGERGIKIEGRLPELKAGILTLEFLLTHSKVRIWYGPKIELLRESAFSLENVVDGTLAIYDELNAARFKDENDFINLLFEAYETVVRKEQKETGANVSIISWLSEIAWHKQDKRFISDPKRENFRSYGRTQFSYDLFHLRVRECRKHELRLIIASREQTKHKEDNLWIPSNSRGEGTHFASVSFKANEIKGGFVF